MWDTLYIQKWTYQIVKLASHHILYFFNCQNNHHLGVAIITDYVSLPPPTAIHSFIHAYKLTLGLHVFRQTGPPRRVGCLTPLSVCHIKTEASRLVPCPRTQQASLPACSPHYPLSAERQAGKL